MLGTFYRKPPNTNDHYTTCFIDSPKDEDFANKAADPGCTAGSGAVALGRQCHHCPGLGGPEQPGIVDAGHVH